MVSTQNHIVYRLRRTLRGRMDFPIKIEYHKCMILKEIDVVPPINSTLIKLLPQGETILNNFPVFILEPDIKEHGYSEIFVTQNYLILHYDFKLEFYNINTLELYTFGDKPKFTLTTQLIEQRYSIVKGDQTWLREMIANESLYRIVFNEIGGKQKTILLRERDYTAKTYKNWALYQILVNHKNKTPQDPILREIASGNFTRFNEKAILTILGVFLGFILLNIISSLVFPELLDTILTFSFGIFCIGALVWAILSINKNNKRFLGTYLRYNTTNLTENM